MSTDPFSFPIRVYWEDTDAGGVVYHGSYVRFLERARTEWLRAQGVGQQDLRDREDVVLVIRDMTLDFLQPARLDDELRVRSGAGGHRAPPAAGRVTGALSITRARRRFHHLQASAYLSTEPS